MKKAFAIMLATSICVSASAQEAFMAPLVEQSVLLDVAATDFVVIVGERGHILTSSDGETFTQQRVPSQSTLTATDIVEDNVWAVGHDAVILHSSDRGVTWEQQLFAPEKERPFLDVLFFDSNHGIAVGAYGMFYRTRDGGDSWEAERHPSLLDPLDQEYLESVREESEEFYQQELNSILPHINRVTLHRDRLYMAGEAGLLAFSDDMGASWTRYEVDYTGSFFDIKPIDATTMVAAGLRGNLFVMHQAQWQYVNTCSNSTLNSIFVAAKDKIVALGNNGILVSGSRPLPVSERDPYVATGDCERPPEITVNQLKDKAAILNATRFNGRTLAVTANGIKHLDLE